MFAAGYCLPYILALPPNIWVAKDKRSAAPPAPENAAYAVVVVFNVVEQTHEKLYLVWRLSIALK
jgi:hypothetical protein